jgi:hypothetical protein
MSGAKPQAGRLHERPRHLTVRARDPIVVALGALLVARPAMYRIPLDATTAGRGAQGIATLARPASPFAMPVTRDGHIIYDVAVSVQGLPEPANFGGATRYVAWVTVPDLSLVHSLGPLAADGTAHGQVAWNKFIVLVTAERTAGAKWAGPILLKGASPSTWMQRFQAHVLGNGGNPDW